MAPNFPETHIAPSRITAGETPDKFFKEIEKTFSTGLDIIRKKNHDYGGPVDHYKNFRFAEQLGVSVEKGILVRISDKLARISNLLDRPAAVADEKIEDTILDAINYLAILKAYIYEKEQE